MSSARLRDGWRSARIDRVATVRARIGWKALTADEYKDDGYAFLATPNIKGVDIDFDNVNYISEYRYDESPELKLAIGDVLLAKDGNTLGITNVVTYLPRAATVNGSIAVIRPTGVDSRFMRYWIASDYTQRRIDSLRAGMGVPHLFQWDINRLPIMFPARQSDQTRIADFLDAETARIDALIAKKNRVMELVHLRNRAEVDELTGHGNAVRVRRVSESITSGPRGWSEQVGEVGSPFIRSANLRRDEILLRSDNLMRVDVPLTAEAARSQVRQGDTLVGITGANTGWVGLAGGNYAGGFISQHVARIRPRGVTPEWLAFSMFAQRSQEQLLGGQYGGTKQQLGLEDIAELTIRVPSKEEQRELVHSLQRAARLKMELVEKLKRQIDLLKEHRQALITAAVTGEMEVSGVSR